MKKEIILDIVRRAEDNYETGMTNLGEFVEWSHRDTVERIIAYINSKHTSGDKDSLGRDKPFFNIITAAVNIWYRATDIDRKDITIRPTKSSDTIASFLASVKLQDWMRRTDFGTFLNKWGRILSQYGSAVVKFVEKDGELIPSVVPWNRIITDAVDFDALPRIEKLYKTPAQIMQMPEIDKETAENLIENLVSRKNAKNQKKDNLSEFVELYEVHGELPIALLTDDPSLATDDEWNTYRQQMHLVSFIKNKATKDYDDFTLYKGKEKNDPYLLTHLIEEDGRVMGIGAVEHLFDSQWMQNHTMKNLKDTLDLSSKLIFQTSDGNFIGRNVLTAIETGDIMIHKENQPLTQINNTKADITALQNFAGQWKVLAMEITSTPEALRGTTMPSGTPYSLGALLSQQAGSLFEIMVENKGLYLEQMLRKFIIPHLKTKLDTTDEIVAVLEDYDLKKIDALYIPNAAIKNYNERTKNQILNGQPPEMFNKIAEESKVTEVLSTMGNMRIFSPDKVTWKEVFKDIEWEVEVGITNEPADKQAVMTSLTTVLQTIASNPMVLQDPNMKMILGKILSFTGIISPVELSTMSAQPSPLPSGAGMAMPEVESLVK